MLAESHQKLADKIWAVANKLRGPYRPPQYRKVMLPLIVLRRLDCVLEPTKDQVLKQVAVLKAKKLSPEAIEKALAKIASKNRKQPLFNVSPYTFPKLLGESAAIARNLTAYIKGFSPNARKIFERFEFETEIEKLDENNMLFEIIKEFSTLDLHPDTVPNLEMGYLFEYLNAEPDPDLRDVESVPLPKNVPMPLPIGYKGANGKEPDNESLVALVRNHCDSYFAREVKPHWPDAWIDYSKTRVGFELPVNRFFYVYEAPRPLDVIAADIKSLEGEILDMLGGIAA